MTYCIFNVSDVVAIRVTTATLTVITIGHGNEIVPHYSTPKLQQRTDHHYSLACCIYFDGKLLVLVVDVLQINPLIFLQ